MLRNVKKEKKAKKRHFDGEFMKPLIVCNSGLGKDRFDYNYMFDRKAKMIYLAVLLRKLDF